MPKVAFAHYSSHTDLGGVTTWLVALARQLIADDVEVAIHLQHEGSDSAQATILPQLADAGIHISMSAKQKNLALDVRQTLAFLNDWQPSVFLPQCQSAHYVAAAIAGQQGLPWALTIHSDDSEYWAAAKCLRPSIHGGHVVSVSDHINSQVLRSGIDVEPSLIPYGVSIPRSQSRYDDRPFRIAFSGRLWEHQKRASLVIDTLIRTCRLDASIVATVIGDGYARQACQEQVMAAGLNHAITFTGRLPPAEVQTILLDCQAILLMSDFEGLPVALLEAMAAGVVPVVRSIPSGIPELIHHEQTGLLVSDDPDDAAAALIRLARDPSLWHHCSAAARQLVVETYSAEKSYARWLALIESLQRRSAPRYPIQFRGRMNFRDLDPLLHAPYQSSSGLKVAARKLISTYLAQAKHVAKNLLSAS